MNVGIGPSPRTLRCSSVTRRMEVPPTATAGSFGAVLVLDWPLPWRADAALHPELEPLVQHVRSCRVGGGPVRLQLRVPDGAAGVTLYRRRVGPFVAYERCHSEGDASTVVERAIALLAADDAPGTSPVTQGSLTEILVCTHGKRDVCCGSLGPAVHRDLSSIHEGSSTVAVRRTSHLGGHRFAPTVAVMPTGTSWAWVDAELVCGIVEQSLPIDRVIRHFRGTMGIDEPEVQAVDAALFAEVGWSWLGRPRTGAVLERDGDEAHVELEHATADGRWSTTATVVMTGTNPIPGCGVPLDGTEKAQPVWTVGGLATRAAS